MNNKAASSPSLGGVKVDDMTLQQGIQSSGHCGDSVQISLNLLRHFLCLVLSSCVLLFLMAKDAIAGSAALLHLDKL